MDVPSLLASILEVLLTGEPAGSAPGLDVKISAGKLSLRCKLAHSYYICTQKVGTVFYRAS